MSVDVVPTSCCATTDRTDRERVGACGGAHFSVALVRWKASDVVKGDVERFLDLPPGARFDNEREGFVSRFIRLPRQRPARHLASVRRNVTHVVRRLQLGVHVIRTHESPRHLNVIAFW